MVFNVGFACSIPTTLRFIGKKTNYGCFVTVIALLRFADCYLREKNSLLNGPRSYHEHGVLGELGEAEESGLVQLDRVDRVAVLDPSQGLEKPKLF